MTRHRTPTSLIAASGGYTKNPARLGLRADEPVPAGLIGDAPPHLNAARARCFSEIVCLSHAGVLSSADAIGVEVAACLLAAFRDDPIAFSAAKLARLESLLAKFGLTPADRSKVRATPRSSDAPIPSMPASSYLT